MRTFAAEPDAERCRVFFFADLRDAVLETLGRFADATPADLEALFPTTFGVDAMRVAPVLLPPVAADLTCCIRFMLGREVLACALASAALRMSF